MYAPEESNKQASGLAFWLALVCFFALTFELTRSQSKLGWFIRDASDKVISDDTIKFEHLKISTYDIDVMTRTVIGESAREPDIGKIAVCHVIMNRAKKNLAWYGGNKISSVALHKSTSYRGQGRKITTWQFEPWMSRSEYLWKIPITSPLYQRVNKLVIDCVLGKHPDPTGGATHFLEPNIVKARNGGVLPKWARGEGRSIGRHVFYRH